MDYEGAKPDSGLLVEDMTPPVDKTRLMKEAIPFFFTCYSKSGIKPAFDRDDCFLVFDERKCITVLIFGFDKLETTDHINMFLLGKFQMEGWSEKEIRENIFQTARVCKWSPANFITELVTYLRLKTKGHVERVLTDVMSFRIEKGIEKEYITRKLWPTDDLSRLIDEMGATVYDYTKKGRHGAINICADLTITNPYNWSRLITTSIHCLYPQFRDIKNAFGKYEEFSALCWRAKHTNGDDFLLCFEIQCTKKSIGWLLQNVCKLSVKTVPMNNVKFYDVLCEAKSSSSWSNVKDESSFSYAVWRSAKMLNLHLENDKTSIYSLRYGKNEDDKYVYSRVKTNDSFSRMVEQSGGTIYMDYEGSDAPPRLLVEDLESTVNRRQLMEEAIPFFFHFFPPSYRIKPAFDRVDCFLVSDERANVTVIIFGFERFGVNDHINLVLHGRFYMYGFTEEDIESLVSDMEKKSQWTSSDFPTKVAEYFRKLEKDIQKKNDL